MMFRSHSFIHATVVLFLVAGLETTGWARGPLAAGGRGAHGQAGSVPSGPNRMYRGPVAGPRPSGYHGFAGHPPPHAPYYGPRWGHPYYGWGYPYYGYPYYGYSVGVGVGYGYPVYVPYNAAPYSSTTTVVTPTSVVTASNTIPPRPSPPDVTYTDRGRDFDDKGKQAFRTGSYADAAYEWPHAVVDVPQNPTLVMQLALALFALEKYEESAGATQAAMRQMQKEHWGEVISSYRELYGDPAEYTRQLRALESAITKAPENPALRFLAGYHFGYLGFRKQSIEQLDKLISIEPRDELAKNLRELFQEARTSTESPPALPPVPAFDQTERVTK